MDCVFVIDTAYCNTNAKIAYCFRFFGIKGLKFCPLKPKSGPLGFTSTNAEPAVWRYGSIARVAMASGQHKCTVQNCNSRLLSKYKMIL